MKDAKSTVHFVQALNESLESGALMCQLYNAELNKYIMTLTSDFCRRQSQLGTPRARYEKKAAECLGKQPDSEIWILNDKIHLNEDGVQIDPSDSEYIWISNVIGNRNFLNVAPASDAAFVTLEKPSVDALLDTLTCLKSAVQNNFTPAFVLIASAAMAVHYESVVIKYGMCPTPVAIGPKNTGKSTAAKTALALLGTPHFFVRDFTTVQTTELCSRKTFPTVLDDPTDIGKVKTLVGNTFNAGARCTARQTSISRTTAIVTINLDKMKSLCSNYKESSRVVFVPFERPKQKSASVDDTELLQVLNDAGDAVPLFIRMGKSFNLCDRSEINHKITKILNENHVCVTQRIIRIYTILFAFTIQLAQLCNSIITEEELWTFFSSKMVPSIQKWQVEEGAVGEISTAAVDEFLTQLVQHIEDNKVSVNEILQVVNPSVTNLSKTKYFVAIKLGDVSTKFSFRFQRSALESTIKYSGCGDVSVNRYFLKPNEEVACYSDVTKQKMQKYRCCIVDHSFIDNSLLKRLYAATKFRTVNLDDKIEVDQSKVDQSSSSNQDDKEDIEHSTTTEDAEVEEELEFANESDVNNSKPKDSPEKKKFEDGIGKRVRGRKSKKRKETAVEKSMQPKKKKKTTE